MIANNERSELALHALRDHPFLKGGCRETGGLNDLSLDEVRGCAARNLCSVSYHPELRGVDFHEHYRLVVAHSFRTSASADRVVLRPGALECCICGRKPPDATFDTEAHVIPALAGNKWLFSGEECDTCNQRFQDDESDLGAMTLPERSFAGVRGRRGAAKLRAHSNAKASLVVRPGSEHVTLSLHEDDPSFRVQTVSESEYRLVVPAPPYSPAKVERALAKAAWLALPCGVRIRYPLFREWLRGTVCLKDAEIGRLFCSGGLDMVGIAIWELHDQRHAFPPLVSMMYFGQSILLWSMPNFTLGVHVPGPTPDLPLCHPQRLPPTGKLLRARASARQEPTEAHFVLRGKSPLLGYLRAPEAVVVEAQGTIGAARVETALLQAREAIDLVEYVFEGGQLAGTLVVQVRKVSREIVGFSTHFHVAGAALGAVLATVRLGRVMDGAFQISARFAPRHADPREVFSGHMSHSADDYRNDLADIESIARQLDTIGNRYGLEFEFPMSLTPAESHQIDVLATAIGCDGVVSFQGTETPLFVIQDDGPTLDAKLAEGPSELVLELRDHHQLLGRFIEVGPHRVLIHNPTIVPESDTQRPPGTTGRVVTGTGAVFQFDRLLRALLT